MRRHRFVSMAIVIAWAFSQNLFAQEAKVDLREIRREQCVDLKEPDYKHAPRYALLVTGPNAQKRNWLVLDGFRTVYLDLNENGDLTEDGEKFICKAESSGGTPRRHLMDCYFEFNLSKKVKIKLEVSAPNPEFVARGEEEQEEIVRYREFGWVEALVDRQSGGGNEFNRILFAKTPEEAQVIWFDGPLSIIPVPELYGKKFELKTRPDYDNEKQLQSGSFSVSVGTLGLPADNSIELNFTSINSSEIPASIKPVATFGFETGDVNVSLDHERGSRFSGNISIPENHTADNVPVVIAFSNWKKQNIESIKRIVPIKRDSK
jgi:hypothetical protein